MLVATIQEVDGWTPVVDRAGVSDIARLNYDLNQCRLRALANPHLGSLEPVSADDITGDGLTFSQKEFRHDYASCMRHRNHEVIF